MNFPLECTLPKKVVLPAQQSNLCLKQVHQSTATCGSLSLGQLQASTGSFVCLFWEKKKWGACLNGAFVIWAGEHKKHRQNTWTLCASNTSALHLIQCQHMPPLSAIVASFLSVRNIFFFFHKGYCFQSRHSSERRLLVLSHCKISLAHKSQKHLWQFGN